MEELLLSASLKSRSSYELIDSHINTKMKGRGKSKSYTLEFMLIFQKIGDYYRRDPEATSVDRTLLIELVSTGISNEKHLPLFVEKIDEAYATETSEPNVKQYILLAKRNELGDTLAERIANREPEPEMVEEYLGTLRASSLDELGEQGTEVFDKVDLFQLIDSETDYSNRIKLYPLDLNARTNGAARGHHIVVFARPEMGKTAAVITMGAGCARQGLRVGHFINEDRPQDLLIRYLCNMSDMTATELSQNKQEAITRAEQRGFSNVYVISMAPGTLAELEKYIDELQLDVIIVDQLRNLAVKADNRVIQLEQAATGVRTIAKKKNVLAISVTQAGDSAEGKAVLDQGDVDFSNTGIPAQADLMIGIGRASSHGEDMRTYSMPKNKLSGKHEAFLVRLSTGTSKYTSIRN